jgi:hypothetical protein
MSTIVVLSALSAGHSSISIDLSRVAVESDAIDRDRGQHARAALLDSEIAL